MQCTAANIAPNSSRTSVDVPFSRAYTPYTDGRTDTRTQPADQRTRQPSQCVSLHTHTGEQGTRDTHKKTANAPPRLSSTPPTSKSWIALARVCVGASKPKRADNQNRVQDVVGGFGLEVQSKVPNALRVDESE